jgi:hypothetical protein
MKKDRCPYHVKQGVVDAKGKFILSDICGIKSACGAACPIAPFHELSYKGCDRYLSFVKGTDRQVLIPKNDIEYMTEVSVSGGFSEIDIV